MALFIQHGHGKGQGSASRLEGTVGDCADGVIFAPRNESLANLQKCVSDYREICTVLIDPQFYVSMFDPANPRYLLDYPYFREGMTLSDFSARRIWQIAKSTIDFQIEVGASELLSPTILFENFTDRSHQVAIQLAEASIEYHDSLTSPPKLNLSFVMAQRALNSNDDVDRFLDQITQPEWESLGFYFVCSHTDPYSQHLDPNPFGNLMYLTYVLSLINNVEVIHGYCDMSGLMLRAVGAKAFASGWSQTLRHFEKKNYLKRKPGGQAPRLRYTSTKLLNSILQQELNDIWEADQLVEVLSEVELDSVIEEAESPNDSEWSLFISQKHHFQCLGQLDQRIDDLASPQLELLARMIRRARANYSFLEGLGVAFDRATGKDHLQSWTQAINQFRLRAGL